MGAASAAIHQLRYAVGYGDDASTALAAHPHGYLMAALPGLATAALIAFAAMLMRAAGANPRRTPDPRGSLLALWLACAFALAAIYGAQETLEGAGALAGGGWIGIALAIPAGLFVALAIRGADAGAVVGIELGWLVTRILAALAAVGARGGRAFTRLLRARGPPQAFVV